MTAAYSRPHAPLFTIDLDGSTITIRPAPDREPPFDDERHPDDLAPVCLRQGALPFPPAHPPIRHRPALRPRSPQRAAVPEPETWARRLLIGIIEVASQRRPLAQLARLLSPSVGFGLREDLAKAAARSVDHRIRGTTIGSVRSSEPADGIAEVCATLCSAERVHAVALRMEIRRGQWICTRLVIG